MFTGIIEVLGEVKAINQTGQNFTYTIESPISSQLKVDQSVAHNGACLTVESIDGHTHTVTAIDETIAKTNLGDIKVGDPVNLERCLQLNGRLDGHMVQGHVDTTGNILGIESQDGSYLITIQFNTQFAHLLVEKGSVCINGISLTVFNITESTFQVAIIPYTWDHTNLSTAAVGQTVNLEFDILGKYVSRITELKRI